MTRPASPFPPDALAAWIANTQHRVPLARLARACGVDIKTIRRRLHRIEDLTDCPASADVIYTVAGATPAPAPGAAPAPLVAEDILAALGIEDEVEALVERFADLPVQLAASESCLNYVADVTPRAIITTAGGALRVDAGPEDLARLGRAGLVLGFLAPDLTAPAGALARLRLTDAGLDVISAERFPPGQRLRAMREVGVLPPGREAEVDDLALDLAADPAAARARLARFLPPPVVAIVADYLSGGLSGRQVEARHGLANRTSRAITATALSVVFHGAP